MTDRAKKSPAATQEMADGAQAKLVPQMAMMLRALLASPVRNTLFALGAALVGVVILTAYGQIRLNAWNKPFYDALAHRDLGSFFNQLRVFGMIAGGLLILNVGQRWLVEMSKLKLREGLAKDLIENWLQPMRAFRMASAGAIGVNPDQRMHEDARHLTELSADLGTQLLQAGVLVASFVSVLWQISSTFTFHIHGHAYAISGYMVWAAVIYAGSASLLTYWVGRSLVSRNAERYAREADLRFSLVRVNEHVDAISLAKGEAHEARRIEADVTAVLGATRRLILGLTNLTWVTAGYGWFTLVAPILAAAPLYFSNELSFGGLMMAAGAFTQVQTSLRWFVDNFSVIADWRATLLRVASYRRAVVTMDELHSVESEISYTEGDSHTFGIEKLEIASPAGATMLKEAHIKIDGGERLLISGAPGTGKTLLFRALAGLWPWGSGTVTRPKGEEILYMPRTPYWPPGTLREAMSYPRSCDDFKDAAYKGALEELSLQRLIPILDKTRSWQQQVSAEELSSLAFARVVLHAPPWIVMDEVLDSLDGDTLKLIRAALARELKGSAVIHVGRPPAGEEMFKRVVHLVKDPEKRRLPSTKPGTPAEETAVSHP
ncbi:MAG TPA: ABC transporter ATP-binding protein/permease [Steroidobacteraceae bacterium]|jgi:putative ATP-binding cassette transporter